MDPSESSCIDACRAGRLDAFDVLYDRYVEPIHRYVSRRVLSREIAEDLVSITFLKALENIRSFDPAKGVFRAWLYRIARNSLIDYYRDPSRRTANIEDAWDLPGDDVTELAAERSIDLERVRKALAQLKPLQREIVMLRIWDDLSYREIAAIVGKTESNCKMLYSRAMRGLRMDLVALVLLVSLFPFRP
jgi:RNA polymerase sigma-70 factor (ECF subfamily)